MSFYNNFTLYDECAPAGVLLPKISIEDKYYKELRISTKSSNLQFLKKLWEILQEAQLRELLL